MTPAAPRNPRPRVSAGVNGLTPNPTVVNVHLPRPTCEYAQAAGKALASPRRKVTLECPVCGRMVKGSKARRYCSAACRQEAYRQRRK